MSTHLPTLDYCPPEIRRRHSPEIALFIGVLVIAGIVVVYNCFVVAMGCDRSPGSWGDLMAVLFLAPLGNATLAVLMAILMPVIFRPFIRSSLLIVFRFASLAFPTLGALVDFALIHR